MHCNGHQCFLGDIAEIYQPKTITGLEMSNGGQYPVFGANGIIGHYHCCPLKVVDVVKS